MAYEVDLLDSLKALFPAFHPWLLHRFNNNPLPGQPTAAEYAAESAGPELAEDDDDGTPVRAILDSKIDRRRNDPHTGQRGCLMYKVEWDGDDQSEQWQPYYNLAGCADTVHDFHIRNTAAKGPHETFVASDYAVVAAAVIWVAGLLPAVRDDNVTG